MKNNREATIKENRKKRGVLIQENRIEKNKKYSGRFTQEKVAERLGICPNNYGKGETEGQGLDSLDRIQRICEELDIPLYKLVNIGYSGSSNSDNDSAKFLMEYRQQGRFFDFETLMEIYEITGELLKSKL